MLPLSWLYIRVAPVSGTGKHHISSTDADALGIVLGCDLPFEAVLDPHTRRVTIALMAEGTFALYARCSSRCDLFSLMELEISKRSFRLLSNPRAVVRRADKVAQSRWRQKVQICLLTKFGWLRNLIVPVFLSAAWQSSQTPS